MIVAAVLVAIGLIGFVVGAVVGASIEETFNNLSTVDYTTTIGSSGEVSYTDADGMGEEGYYLLIPGDPKVDENNDGIMDACEGINFLIIDGDGDDATERAARFPVPPPQRMKTPTQQNRTGTSKTPSWSEGFAIPLPMTKE